MLILWFRFSFFLRMNSAFIPRRAVGRVKALPFINRARTVGENSGFSVPVRAYYRIGEFRHIFCLKRPYTHRSAMQSTGKAQVAITLYPHPPRSASLLPKHLKNRIDHLLIFYRFCVWILVNYFLCEVYPLGVHCTLFRSIWGHLEYLKRLLRGK